jgi:hypothetical protein
MCRPAPRRRTRTPRPRLGVERLDERIVPAGNVTAVFQNGQLILTGDGEDNSIELRNGFDFRVAGLDGTTINGAAGFDDFSGVKDVIINLKGGEDTVSLEGGGGGTAAVISRDLIFTGGGGADTLTSVAGAVIGRDLIFQGGGGTSSATLDDLIVGRQAVFTGNANVLVQSMNGTTVHGVLRVNSVATASVTLDGGVLGRLNVVADGLADVDMTSVLVGGNARIRGGSGNDVIEMSLGCDVLGNLTIYTRAGNDSVEPDAEVGGNATILLGTGANEVLDIFNMTVYGDLTIVSEGSGTDDWTLEGLEVLGRTTLTSGGGADTVVFNDAEFFGRVTFLGGGGGDQVQVSDGDDVTFHGPTLFDLGNGADTLQLGAGGLGEANFLFLVTLEGGNGADTLNEVNPDYDQAPTVQGF